MKKIASIALFISLIVLILSFNNAEIDNNKFKDPRDGKTYKTITIGDQTWMAENLNFKTPNSWCADCEKLGMLYNFEDAKIACPEGWHLPSVEEWQTLIDNLGGQDSIYYKLTEIDSNSFSSLFAHYRTVDGKIRDKELFAHYWTSTSGVLDGTTFVETYTINKNQKSVSKIGFMKTSGFSIRCIKNKK